MSDLLTALGGPARAAAPGGTAVGGEVAVEVAAAADDLAAHAALRHAAFVADQGRFAGHDRDPVDDDPRTTVLIARRITGSRVGQVVGGVRLAPCTPLDLGWWAGSRLVVAGDAPERTGSTLVRAACAHAVAAGVLRFDALVQPERVRMFERLGWHRHGTVVRHGGPHAAMRYPVDRIAAVAASKAPLGPLLAGLSIATDPGGAATAPGGPGFVGDDAAPVPGSDLLAACDAIVPAMVERDPWWAGWCGVLVNLNDLAAVGAEPVGLLDALAAPTRSLAARVLAGLRDAAARFDVPILGGHTQLDVPAALSVTALGRATTPTPGGGGRPGDGVSLAVDLSGGWRPGYHGRQWDSTTGRDTSQLRTIHRHVAEARPHAAKDVSMAGIAGTLGMLAEASGTGAELDVADVPRPASTTVGDWLTCFPGSAFLTTGPARPTPATSPLTVAGCGRLTAEPGVRLVWPDGVRTTVLTGAVTGLGPTARHAPGARTPAHLPDPTSPELT